MANSNNSMPILLDTDTNSWGKAQTLQATPFGLRVWKIALFVNTTSIAGTVNIVDPNDNTVLLAPMVVPAAGAAGTLYFYDNPIQLLQWRDFKVTGLTATSTKLMIWYRV